MFVKSYPKIPGSKELRQYIGQYCHGFRKYDGSNIRAEWSKKRGWYKFGSRTKLIDSTDLQLGPSVNLFLDKYGKDIERILLRDFAGRNTVVFFEYFGPNSFAGTHVETDIKDVVVFDVSIDRHGMLSPIEFLTFFGQLQIAEIIYHGPLTQPFIENVRENCYFEGHEPLIEGLVVKGGAGNKLWRGKIKCNAYLEKLKRVFYGDWEQYGE